MALTFQNVPEIELVVGGLKDLPVLLPSLISKGKALPPNAGDGNAEELEMRSVRKISICAPQPPPAPGAQCPGPCLTAGPPTAPPPLLGLHVLVDRGATRAGPGEGPGRARKFFAARCR